MDKEKYEILLDALAEKIKKQNDDILFKDIQISNLLKKLEEAEKSKKPAISKNLEIRKGV